LPEIAQYANRKMLKEAQQCFETAIAKNLANSHTYTIMINAHVRCGDADGAAKVLKRMSKASLQPCVVAYTTLINGKCRAGDLQGGMEVLRAMLERRPPVMPNVRTVNTLLRGCMLVGGVSEAKSLFERMLAEWGAQPDASTYEYVVSLLSQALRLEEAGSIVDELRRAAASAKDGEGDTAESVHATVSAQSPLLYVSMARASALLADWAQFAKAHKRALKALKSAEKSAQSAQQVVAGEEGSRGAVVGGKQGWRVRDDSRQNSANVFDAHRRDELQRELAEIDAYRTRVDGAGDADAAAEEADGAKGAQTQQLLKLLVFLRRVVSCYIYGTLPKP
jgi:pentatricopeptide repeat protein